MGANADAFHSVDVATGPLLEGCEVSGNCDDFINVHSTIHVLYGVDVSGCRVGQPCSAMLIDPRLGALGNTPLAGRVDMWYGTSSPVANLRRGDVLQCHLPNTKPRYARGKDGWRRWGGSLRLDRPATEERNESLLAQAAAVQASINSASANPPLMGWKSLKLWQVSLLTDTALPRLPAGGAVLCDVVRFGGRGAVVRGNFFHDLGTNGGLRWKSSGSQILDNTVLRAGNASRPPTSRISTGVEISALQDWMEGPMQIDGVRVSGNRWVDCGMAAVPVTVMPEATNVTQTNNTAS